MMSNILRLHHCEISKGDTKLLSIDATIHGGQILTIKGPSGSGKSTLLSYITGTIDPVFSVSGTVFLNKRDITSITPNERKIGMMFQDSLLFEHMTVAQNIAFGMPSSRDKKAKKRRINDLLSSVQLQDYADRAPSSLSGGQQARVSLLRMLASEPKAILLDEPFSKLDSHLRSHTRQWVFDCIAKQHLPAILVTHDDSDADAAGNDVVEL